MSSFPYVQTSNVFNTADYNVLDSGLTIEQANRLYLSLGGGTVSGNINTNTLSASTSINSAQYLLSGSAINFSAITGVVNGTATANKALILDSALEIGTLSAITSNIYNGTTANIQFLNNDINTSAINCNAPIFYALDTNNTATYQTYQQWSNTIGTPITTELKINNSNVQFGNTSNHALIFLTNNTQKMVLNAGGNLSIGNTNNTHKLDVSGATMTTTLRIRANGDCPEFIVDSLDGVGGFDSGLRIYPATSPILQYGNMAFFGVGGTTAVASISCKNQNCFHTRPQSNADQNATMPNVGFVAGNNAIFRDSLMITANSLTNSTNFTPVTKFNITADTEFVDGSYNKALRITNANFVNEFQIQIGNANGDPTFFGNISNTDLRFGTNNSTKMIITAAGRLGVGTNTPNAPLQVAGSNSSITIIPITTISYSYDVASNNWQNRGGGPFTLTNVSASFGGNIYIQAGIWATSDKRLKENIKEIDLPFERYKALKPVSYNYKLEEKSRVGFIAQDVMEVCAQAISMSANENLKDEGLNSPEGVQLSLDYNAITVLNTNIIQKLIERVELLENELKNIKSNI